VFADNAVKVNVFADNAVKANVFACYESVKTNTLARTRGKHRWKSQTRVAELVEPVTSILS
jgi:hypothetical protein